MKLARPRRSLNLMLLVSASMLAMAFATMAHATPQKWEPAPVPSERAMHHSGSNGGAPSYPGAFDPERDYPGFPSCRGPATPYSGAPCVHDIPYGPY